MVIVHDSPSQPETIVTDSQDVGELAEAICVSAREALAPSAYRKLAWAVQAGLDRKFGSALANARRFVEESVELACLQADLGRHVTDCPQCCLTEVRCIAAADMERRENELLGRLAGGF